VSLEAVVFHLHQRNLVETYIKENVLQESYCGPDTFMGDDLREALMVGCDVTSLQFFKFHSNNRRSYEYFLRNHRIFAVLTCNVVSCYQLTEHYVPFCSRSICFHEEFFLYLYFK